MSADGGTGDVLPALHPQEIRDAIAPAFVDGDATKKTILGLVVATVVQIHSDIEEAARVYGAAWAQSMREVFLPLFANTAAVIWFFLLIHIFQLLTIALITYSSDTIVIPVELFNRFYTDAALDELAAISTLTVGMTVLVILALRRAGVTYHEMGQR